MFGVRRPYGSTPNIGDFRRFGCLFKSLLRLLHHHRDPLMDLRRLDRQHLGNSRDRFITFQLRSNDRGLLFCCEFSARFGHGILRKSGYFNLINGNSISSGGKTALQRMPTLLIL
jgi:hypothetical protein